MQYPLLLLHVRQTLLLPLSLREQREPEGATEDKNAL